MTHYAATVEITATGIMCGNCKHHHPTVAQVRACHQGAPADKVSQSASQVVSQAASRAMYGAQPEPLASKRQRSFIHSLSSERGVDRGTVEDMLNGLTMRQASAKIKELLATPKTTEVVEKITMPKVPEGHYSVIIDGETKFFKVEAPTDGQWAGRIFLKIQASDAEYPVKNPTTKAQVLALIAANPKEAMLLYGRQLGHCGHCGRTLTNEESREYGIGPICRGKMGW